MSGDGLASDVDFSIVIPTRNRPRLLRRAVDSALRQTHRSYEIIVVDDASDPPASIDRGRHAAVSLVRCRSRAGVAAARNIGASHARGRWISLLDDDDEYEPEFLSETHSRLRAAPEHSFSWCSAVVVEYDHKDRALKETLRRFKEEYPTEEALLATTVSIGSGYGLTVRSRHFRELGGFDTTFKLIEDTDFFFRLLAAGVRPVVLSRPLVRIHNHRGQRLTDRTSNLDRIRECERLQAANADLIARYPALGAYIRFSVEQLSGPASR
jgi:glycosyltransferase involved in cell wall biosynthesis